MSAPPANLSERIISGVLEGNGGYLFAMDEPEYLRLLLGERPLHAQPLANFAENMTSRKAKTRSSQVPWAHTVIPDKPTVIPDRFPSNSIVPVGQQFVAAALSSLPFEHLIYPLELLRQMQSQKHCYSRIESHPGHSANVTMLQQLMAAIGFSVPAKVWEELFASSQLRLISGDLGLRIGSQIQDIHEMTVFAWPVRSFDNGLPAMYDGMMELHVNRCAYFKKRLLIFGNSCMWYIAKIASRLFSEILFCRSLFFHDEILEAVCPDAVLTGHSDRYCWLRSDRERPMFLSLPGLYGLSLPDRRQFWELADAMMMSSFEAHRFPYALAAAIG